MNPSLSYRVEVVSRSERSQISIVPLLLAVARSLLSGENRIAGASPSSLVIVFRSLPLWACQILTAVLNGPDDEARREPSAENASHLIQVIGFDSHRIV